jgi:hypothetical protein
MTAWRAILRALSFCPTGRGCILRVEAAKNQGHFDPIVPFINSAIQMMSISEVL